MSNKITIIMPTYNAEEYIVRAIHSIIKQTYVNWELIIVDDGSVDSTIAIIKEFLKKDRRIKLIKNMGKGAGAARNTGISNANGDYLAFIDSDDYYDIHYLEEANNYIIDGKDCIIFDYFVFYNNQKGNVRRVGTSPYNSFTACWNKVYKRELWDGIRFDETNKIEDLQVIPIIVNRAKNVCHASSDIYYYYYRDNNTSVTKTETAVEASKIIDAVNILIKRMKEENMDFNKDAAEFINQLVFPHLIMGIKNSKNREEKRKIFLLIAPYLRKINSKLFNIKNNFYCKNRAKYIRTEIVIFLLNIRLYSLAFLFMKFSWYIGGRLRK
ncbi:glycosyltransferase family 2 protein [Limosilactobacillus sp. RRLNB_1_1]|uniref:Glycosyltransferase family 2 protein n=1 Tax=Limosilactobacillus albertensis TaxID=2759752 RepID=A0A7W3Y975_9LACO|nr:glycosyltransferase family 2 protein [Limosilactobacillus albertensis]MBB1070183.1 glycosyltransferase family 2 protein [Limosilactobacillus albertensis]MCD7119221.1 glycosyltransferase family 2 protein [Limosilactobacillus albertensis]MCD7129429.1 glycosyltransferase family 2 protein [Limosilactobacillus albertensis]